MSYACHYAKLGTRCGTSKDVLTSNEKFFAMTEPDYSKTVTKMAKYPGPECDKLCDAEGKDVNNPKKLCSTGYRASCCGRK